MEEKRDTYLMVCSVFKRKKIKLIIVWLLGQWQICFDRSLYNPGFPKMDILKGKFDQISSNTPYSTFVQAFNELIQMILLAKIMVKWRRK
jgi:hypothetical protein